MATINLGRVGFVNKGTFVNGTAYKINDIVQSGDSVYACLQANTGQPLSNTIFWQLWVNATGNMATETSAGYVELATNAETQTGTDSTRVITPANLKSRETSSATDNTLGKLLKVGDFGLGSALPISDVDSTIVTGLSVWQVSNGVSGTPPAGDVQGDTVLQSAWDTNNRTQIWMHQQGGLSHRHTSTGSAGWSSWKRLYDSVSLPVATDSLAGAVELATVAETQTGTDTTRAVTPAGLQGRVTASASDTTAGRLIKVGDNGTSQFPLLAPLASPSLTGTPTAPTAANGTSTTQIATTAFVMNNSVNSLGDLGLTATAAELNYVDGVTSAIQTQLNAKAALASPSFTGTPTASTAAVGDNSTQLATTAFVQANIKNKNYIINGSFGIWQRGSTQTTSAYGSADRWYNAHVGSTKTVTREAHTLGESLTNSKFYMRTVVNSVAGVNNYVVIIQSIEDVRTLAGKTCTVSFLARANATKNIGIEFTQAFGAGGTPSAVVIGIGSQLVSVSTTWAKYSCTIAIPSIAGKTIGTDGTDSLRLHFWLDAGATFSARAGGLGQQSGTFDISDVQVEVGSTATAFEYTDRATLLTQCQRYYQVVTAHDRMYASGGGQHSDSIVTLPTLMRTTPTLISHTAGSRNNVSLVSYLSGTAGGGRLEILSTAAGDAYALSETLLLDAEL